MTKVAPIADVAPWIPYPHILVLFEEGDNAWIRCSGCRGIRLLAHLTVIAIPVAALMAIVVAVFPRVPGLVKFTTLALGGLSVALVP